MLTQFSVAIWRSLGPDELKYVSDFVSNSRLNPKAYIINVALQQIQETTYTKHYHIKNLELNKHRGELHHHHLSVYFQALSSRIDLPWFRGLAAIANTDKA